MNIVLKNILIYTITSDNGLEFANHQNISKALDYNHYFYHPYLYLSKED
jgi:IS30 family transposase